MTTSPGATCVGMITWMNPTAARRNARPCCGPGSAVSANVKKVVIKGMDGEEAQLLEKWCRRPSPSPTHHPFYLTDRCDALEKYAIGLEFCKDDLQEVLSATETDNVDAFKVYSQAIRDGLRRVWARLSQEKLLWDD